MTTPTESASGWLSRFGAALEGGDVDAAAAMFAEESYWRDLVSFTWNIKTLEGRAEIADMLHAQLEHVQPTGFVLVGDANEADGVIDGWFDFETDGRPRSRPHSAQGGRVLDAADDDGRAERVRGAAFRASAHEVSSTARSGAVSRGWSASRRPSRRSATTPSRTA